MFVSRLAGSSPNTPEIPPIRVREKYSSEFLGDIEASSRSMFWVLEPLHTHHNKWVIQG